jgi:hypothetical protein
MASALTLFDDESPRERRAVVGLLLVGLLIRLTFAALIMGGPYDPYVRLSGDTAKYLSIAVSLTEGTGFSLRPLPNLREAAPGPSVTPFPSTPTSSRSPGYPLFLAMALSILGKHLKAVVVLQAVLASVTPLFIYLAARELRAAPMAALAFGVFYYPFAFDPIFLMSDWAFTLCTAISLWLLVRPRSEILAGLAAGVTVLVKAVTLPFFLLVALARVRRSPLFLAGLVLVAAPWCLRNYVHTGVPYVTASYGGEALFLLHNPWNADLPSFDPPGDVNEDYPGYRTARAEARARAPIVLSPVAQEYLADRELFLEAIRFARANPYQTVRAAVRSFQNTWRLDFPTANGFRWMNSVVLYLGLLPLVLWGVVTALRQGPPGARLVVGFLVCFALTHSVFISQIRYRTAAMPAYFVLAALGIAALVPREGASS